MTNNLLDRFRKWFSNTFVFFGPGLLLAITAAGEAGVTEAIEIGAHYGISLLWVVIITLLFKWAFTNGIARYTLATDHTIFDALSRLPGPKNWGSFLIIISYILEMFAIGAMLLFAATFLDYLLPGTLHLSFIAITLLLIALAILRTHIYHHFELIMAVIVIALGLGLVVVLSEFPFTLGFISEGLIPNIPTGSESSILAIMGVVGSGLNLMLYSVWLKEKSDSQVHNGGLCLLKNESYFRRFIKSVNVDVSVGFIVVFVITIGFMCLGTAGFAVAFMPHGMPLNIDILISMVLNIFNSIPFGTYIFLLLVALIFFGTVIIGIDARAKALTRVVVSIRASYGKTHTPEGRIYQIFIAIFVAIILFTVMYGHPMLIIRFIAVMCAILFGIFGFILIYLESTLPDYAKSSRLWVLIIAVGSILSTYVALLIEGSFLSFGLPMLEHVLVCTVAIYVFCKSKTFKRIANGSANVIDRIWVIFLFGLFSVYGTYAGTVISGDMGSYILNFRDLGAMIGGVLGGPIVGLLTGLVGGVYRLTVGGVTAIPCFLATIVAGVLSGFAIRYWKGRFTMRRALYIAIVVESLHLFMIFPIYSIVTGLISTSAIVDVILTTVMPMIVVNALGLMLFSYLLSKRTEVVQDGLNKVTLRGVISELKGLLHNYVEEHK